MRDGNSAIICESNVPTIVAVEVSITACCRCYFHALGEPLPTWSVTFAVVRLYSNRLQRS